MMRYLVISGSVIVETTGRDADGNETSGRHWSLGALVDLEPADAEAFFAAGVIGPAPGHALALAPGAPRNAPEPEDEPLPAPEPEAAPRAASQPPTRRRGR